MGEQLPAAAAEPAADCRICERLAAYRDTNRATFPSYFNGPVPGFGPADARLTIVGLAPGLHGANQTGRPFTGDYAGDLLYATLLQHGFARGTYRADPQDGLQLVDARIVNAVRCVPPQNKPTGPEIRQCNPFLASALGGRPQPGILLALGGIAHGAILRALGLRASFSKFGHGAEVALPDGAVLLSSYHCSRYNTNTGRLTAEMFSTVFARARAILGGDRNRA